jgi:AcrR family transcriptional regulator
MAALTKPRPIRRVDRRTRGARAKGRDGRAALLEAAAEVFALRGYRDSSVDEIAERAGYSKGAVYWHFSSKDDLFLALLEERIDEPMREAIALLESAPPEQDMAPEANRRFMEVLEGQRDLILLEHEYWTQAVRDPSVRARYTRRQAELRTAFGKAIAARVRHLGGPPMESEPEHLAAAFMALSTGLAQQKLVDPDSLPDDLLGHVYALVYAGHVARAHARGAKP